MILGLGCDIVEINRFEKWLLNKKLQKRYFTNSELEYIQDQADTIALERLAGMFAAKESYIKSVMKAVKLTDVIIERDTLGAPRLRLERSALKALKEMGASYAKLSISHERNYAMAMVVIGC